MFQTLKQRFVEERNNQINLLISRFTFSITFKSMTTSTKSLYLFIFMTKAQVARFIVFSIDFSSMNSIAFKLSRRHEFTYMFFTISLNSFQILTLLHFTSLQKITIIKLKFHYFSIFSIISRSTSTILKFSRNSIIMMIASIVCFFTFSSTSSRSSIFSHQKFYMIINDLFAKFAKREKRFKKNWNTQKKCVFRVVWCRIKLKLLIISNFFINQILHWSNRSNSIFSSIVSIRHFEFVSQSIKMQKFRILRSKHILHHWSNQSKHQV